MRRRRQYELTGLNRSWTGSPTSGQLSARARLRQRIRDMGQWIVRRDKPMYLRDEPHEVSIGVVMAIGDGCG
jgi:hypothetical protein